MSDELWVPRLLLMTPPGFTSFLSEALSYLATI